MPQINHAEFRISVTPISSELQLLSMLVEMAVRAFGLAGEEIRSPIPPPLPEVDAGAAFVVFSTCTADAVLFGVFHQELMVGHILLKK